MPIKFGFKQGLLARQEMESQLSSSPPSASGPVKLKSRWRRSSQLDQSDPEQSPVSSDTNVTTTYQGEVTTVTMEPYDAWDPASHLIATPTVTATTETPKSEKEKKRKKDKDRQSVQNADVSSVSEAKGEEEVKPLPFELIEDNIYLGER